ncbi:MAG: hypothetical protein PHI70_04240 [Proteiniphilum sp.]|nr:hypothetical protein [Proteiniphilum sp.]MDD3908489.1 hypothetical protein [Proteiniphilum sp.]MDD4415978.1 hypothetical protein [Proteiniphilum sp.]
MACLEANKEINMNKSIEELKQLAGKDNAEAQYQLALLLLADAETYWEGIEWLEQAADNGHELAQQAYDDEFIDDDGRFDAWD